MQQQISAVTLGVINLERSKRFYGDGFGWNAVFENDESVFYQMNGLMLGTWLKPRLEEDMRQAPTSQPSPFTLAHNVTSEAGVDTLIARLAAHGGTLLRVPDAPPPGGRRGYVADPDGHAWEINFNPAWPIDAEGRVTFGT